jgi:maltooligosyltrehalose trehalohydrolase
MKSGTSSSLAAGESRRQAEASVAPEGAAGTLPRARLGAHVTPEGVEYRVWAPDHRSVEVACWFEDDERRFVELARDDAGCFSGVDAQGRAGDVYQYRLDGDLLAADPASRFQPFGVEGPSQVIDASTFNWRCTSWKRPPMAGRVIYELHIGTFTPEGTFAAAVGKLAHLVDLGVNTLQIMPVADFAGGRNWGYDGVMPFAPARCYGTPDELRALVDAAHERGLAVVLDVVYNHLGPVGNVLPTFARDYFHTSKSSIWGAGLNFESPQVRRYFLENVAMWIDDFRFDGLRLDATHAIHDESPRHILAEIAGLAQSRGAFVIAEDERNDPKIITPREQGGFGLDAAWADDFHHTVRVSMTAQKEGHFKCYTGKLSEWITTLQQGWLYTGQVYEQWKRPRGGLAAHLPPERFVMCITNHDQVGNRPFGDRLHQSIDPAANRAISMLVCLVPYTPMLFMGQEWKASTPFPFFTDHPGEVGANMARNRIKEFEHYGNAYPPDVLARMPDPQDPQTFQSAKLNWDERERGEYAQTLALYRECLQLRAREMVFQSASRDTWSAALVGPAFVGIRWRAPSGDWLLVVGVQKGSWDVPVTEILRLPSGREWRLVLAGEEARFGGHGPVWHALPDGALGLTGPAAYLFREGPPATGAVPSRIAEP